MCLLIIFFYERKRWFINPSNNTRNEGHALHCVIYSFHNPACRTLKEVEFFFSLSCKLVSSHVCQSCARHFCFLHLSFPLMQLVHDCHNTHLWLFAFCIYGQVQLHVHHSYSICKWNTLKYVSLILHRLLRKSALISHLRFSFLTLRDVNLSA